MVSEGDKAYTAPSAILSVTFGARMSTSDRVMITAALRHQPNVQFKEAILKEGEFFIEIVDI